MADETKRRKIRDEDRTYDPSTPEANRSVDQGNGVGARDLAAQASPTQAAERDPFKRPREAPTEADEAHERAEG